jgi:lipid-A-disaccharide synthase
VVVADTVADDVRGRVAGWPFRTVLVEGDAAKKDAMRAATVALATSGTVSTELALAGLPMVIAYRLGGLSFALTRPMMTARHITLFNIAADERIAPEFLQNEATPEALAKAVAERLDDPALRADQVARQTAALDLMGRSQPDPSAAAADVVLRVTGAN